MIDTIEYILNDIQNNNILCDKIYNSMIKNSYKYKNNKRYIKLLYKNDYYYYTFTKKQLYEFIKYIMCPYTLKKKYIHIYNNLYGNNIKMTDTNISEAADIKQQKKIIKENYSKLLNKKYQKNIYNNKIKNILSNPIEYINSDHNIFYIMSNIFDKTDNIDL